MAFERVEPLRRQLGALLPERPFRVEFWDGSELAGTNGDGPTLHVRGPGAVAHVLRAPGQLGFGRAYAAGEIEVDDLDAVMRLLDGWKPPPLEGPARRRLLLAALRACGLRRIPRPPAAEWKPRGKLHTLERDRHAVRHHYNVSNEFFALFLDESLTYSCGIFSRGASSLEEAQEQKLELICNKLGLQAGQRVLDVGCGWGSFAIHAAARHGAEVVGITLSEPQAELARRRAADAGVGERVEIRVADYRELSDGPFDAIASIGMVEHVGEEQIDVYAQQLARLLRPGGRLLNHGIARLRHGRPVAGPFSTRYVFPDGDPLPLSRVQLALERAGFVTDHVEGFAGDYVETLRQWAQRLDRRLDEATRLAGPERTRVWRLYLRAARNGFENGGTSVYQANCHLPVPGKRVPGAREGTGRFARARPARTAASG